MIEFEDVGKRYIVDKVAGPWVLRGVSLAIPAKGRVGLIGGKASGKTTLIRLVTGSERPTEGKLDRRGRVTTPTQYLQNFQPLLSGRQNARFICRIQGDADDVEARIAKVEALAELGPAFDQPVRSYKARMRTRLSFALSMAVDCEIYVTDGFNFVGEGAYSSKAAADAALDAVAERAALLMTAKGAHGEALLKRHCVAGIWLNGGQARWFEHIADALAADKEARTSAAPTKDLARQGVVPRTAHVRRVTKDIRLLQNSLKLLRRAVRGLPVAVPETRLAQLQQVAQTLGLDLASRDQIEDWGWAIPTEILPILRAKGLDGALVEYFDLNSQCIKSGPGAI